MIRARVYMSHQCGHMDTATSMIDASDAIMHATWTDCRRCQSARIITRDRHNAP